MKKTALILLCLSVCACGGGGTSSVYNQNNVSDDTNNQNANPNNNQTNNISIEHLSELAMRVKGDRTFSTGDIIFISSQNDNTIDTIKLHDNWYNRDIMFSKNQNNKYLATPYSYGLTFVKENTSTGYITFDSDTPLESIEDIKQGFLNALESNAYSYLDAIDKQSATDTINGITISEAQITPITEMPKKVAAPDAVPNKFYIIPTNMEIDVNTYGQLVGLQYSDFGTLTGEQWTTNYENKEKLGYVFAGGTTDKKIIPSDGTMNFSGKAVGQVMLHIADDNGVATNDYMYIASDATLVFDNGTENLTMNFSENTEEDKKWYDVNIVKNNDNVTVNFTNGDKITQLNEKFKFSDAPINKNTEYTNHTSVHSTLSGGWNLHEKADVDIEYYGGNNQISESVGNVGFVQQEWESGTSANKELSFSATFGVTKTD